MYDGSVLQAMLAALLYSTAGLALTAVGALGLMASVAFSSIFVAVAAGKTYVIIVPALNEQHALYS